MQVAYNMVPQAQQMVQQVQGQIKQFGAQLIGDPFAGVNHILVDQIPECIECVCPCFGEKRNKYMISASEPSGMIMSQQLGKVEEQSDWCERFFCQCWRGFELAFFNTQGQVLFQAKRLYKIPSVCCCPCERPELVVSREGQVIGYIKQPWMCIGRSECPLPILEELDICDQQGNVKFYVSGECIQCGCTTRMCGIPRCCGQCRYIDYDIYNPMKQKIGKITNIFNGCINEYCSKADKFLIDFPAGCSFDDKCLIIMATITIDYDNFEYTFCNMP